MSRKRSFMSNYSYIYISHSGTLVVIFKTLFGFHEGIQILGKSFIKWRQRSDPSMAVDWDLKLQYVYILIFRRTYEEMFKTIYQNL